MKRLTIKIAAVSMIAMVALPVMVAPAVSAEGDELKCAGLPESFCKSAKEKELGNSGMWKIVTWVLNTLTFGVGVVAAGFYGFAGLMYATAGADQGKVQKSKEMMVNTTIGVILYIFAWALIQYFIPGGI